MSDVYYLFMIFVFMLVIYVQYRMMLNLAHLCNEINTALKAIKFNADEMKKSYSELESVRRKLGDDFFCRKLN